MRSVLAISSLVTAVAASWGGNLNYRSPSELHPALGISLPTVVKRQDSSQQTFAGKLNFTHGVASGDPYPNSVILWTRASPVMDNDKSNVTVSGPAPLYNHDTEPYVKASKNPICVQWSISTAKDLSRPVSSGKAFTSSDIDYTVKVEATNLKPFTQYYYQFRICNSQKNASPIGRTKTSPAPNDDEAAVNLAVYSCSNFPFGFFNAFGNPVRKNSIDYVIHLGDYYYESKNGDYGNGVTLGRIPLPDKEIFSLYDYRKRIATYRTDLDLLASHQNFAWISVWDDHEVADNTYRDGMSHLNNTEASFIKDGGVSVDQRKMNAVRAYFEWLPIRQVEMDDNLRIWRNFKMGNLFDLVMLDTRQYDRSITDLYWNTDYIHDIANDAGRSMMGSRQENWFYNTLSQSKARGAKWRIIGSQVIFSRNNESQSFGDENPLNGDAWDGYMANKNRTLQHLYNNNITNNIFIAGDSHANWVSDLTWLGGPNVRYDPRTGAGSIGAEFAGTAVSSPSPFGENITVAAANGNSSFLVNNNPSLQWQESYYRGYFELHMSQKAVKAFYYGMPTLLTRNAYEISLANFTVRANENHLQRPVAGGVVENGALQRGRTQQTNITNSTDTGKYSITHFARMNTFSTSDEG